MNSTARLVLPKKTRLRLKSEIRQLRSAGDINLPQLHDGGESDYGKGADGVPKSFGRTKGNSISRKEEAIKDSNLRGGVQEVEVELPKLRVLCLRAA